MESVESETVWREEVNSNPNRLPSLDQPPEIIRQKRIEQIQAYVTNGLVDEARMIDERYKIGYFKKLEEDARPQIDKLLQLFITQDLDMLEMKRQVKILASESDPVLIIGESGTGKELIARALNGNRSMSDFVDINCAGLPEYLIESELFGHVKGAFTGADKDKEGLFKKADGGTLFLDEIGELPLTLQAKLLRALQEKSIRPVGSNKSVPISCRFVCATHCELPQLIKNKDFKKFREDLFFRISTFVLYTKPLYQRLGDIELIVRSLDKEEYGPFPMEKIDWKLLAQMNLLSGNVRSIQHIVRRWQILKTLPSNSLWTEIP